MKRIFLFTLFILSQLSDVQAFDIEARVAYFYPQDSRMRDVYSQKGFAEYEIEVSNPIDCLFKCPKEVDGFVNLSYYNKHGRSSCLNNCTEVTNWALNFGVRRFFTCFECFHPYLGIGGGVAHIRFHDESFYVERHINRWGPALLLKSGVRYDVKCNLFLDLFVDYSYNWFSSDVKNCCCTGRDVNSGGVKVGVGLGYKF